jgi:hypothetical protein
LPWAEAPFTSRQLYVRFRPKADIQTKVREDISMGNAFAFVVPLLGQAIESYSHDKWKEYLFKSHPKDQKSTQTPGQTRGFGPEMWGCFIHGSW